MSEKDDYSWFTKELRQATMERIAVYDQDYRQKAHDWNQRVVGMAITALTVLVSFVPSTGLATPPRVLLALSWVGLGFGIVLGSILLYREVLTAQQFRDKCIQNMETALTENQPELLAEAIFSKPPLFLRWCQTLMVVSLLISVVGLVGFALLQTLV